MTYFFVSLLLCSILSVCLFSLLIYRLRINWTHKNRRAGGFVLPVFLMLIFLGVTVQLTAPRLLDTVSVVTGRLETEELVFSQEQITWNRLHTSSGVLLYNGLGFQPKADIPYRVGITPRSQFVIRIEPIAEPDAEVVSAD